MTTDEWEDAHKDLDEDTRFELRELRKTAIHEAGHFVMSILVKGGMPRRLTIMPTADFQGCCGGAIQPTNPEWAVRAAMQSLAGAYACDVYGWDYDYAGEEADRAAAEAALQSFGCDMEAVERLVVRLLCFKRVARAADMVTDWLIETRNPDMEQIADIWEQVFRRIGFLTRRIDGPIFDLVGRMTG